MFLALCDLKKYNYFDVLTNTKSQVKHLIIILTLVFYSVANILLKVN